MFDLQLSESNADDTAWAGKGSLTAPQLAALLAGKIITKLVINSDKYGNWEAKFSLPRGDTLRIWSDKRVVFDYHQREKRR